MDGKIRLGFAFCGSFCTFSAVFSALEKMAEKYDIYPIMSQTAYNTDTRFGKASDFTSRAEKISGRSVIHTVTEAEPIGPKKLLDALVVAPCTGNTLAKLAIGIADTPVTLAVKAHLRNERPVIIAVSSNDALGANAKNIGLLMNRKHIYFVPFRQDDPTEKPDSLVADMTLIDETVEKSLAGRSIEPIIREK